MEIGIDLIGSLRAGLAAPVAAPQSGVPEWAALRARLHAGYAARRVLLAQGADGRGRGGSFDRAVASTLNTPDYASRAVNLSALNDGKALGGKAAPIAVTSMSGDRG